MKRRYILVLFFFCILFCVDHADCRDYSIPQDKKKTWNIAITQLQNDKVSEEYRYLSSSIPKIMMESFRRCERHTYSKEELQGYKQKLVDMAMSEVKKDLSKLYASRDNAYFSRDREEVQEKTEERILEKEDEIEFLNAIDIDTIELDATKPIEFLGEDETSLLLPYPTTSVEHTAETNKADFLVFGLIEEIEGYFFLKIEAWNTNLSSIVYSVQTGSSKEGINEVARDIAQKMWEHILGHSWSLLSVETIPSGTDIFIDGTFYAQTDITEALLKPGKHALLFRANGYLDTIKDIQLEAGETEALTVSMEPADVDQIFLSTFPEQADVYLSSLWMGRTPLYVDRPDRRMEIVLKKESHHPVVSSISSETPDTMLFTLSPTLFNVADFLKEKKDDFYLSLGAFALSVPLPVILYSITEDIAGSYQQYYSNTTTGEFSASYKTANITYNMYIGSLIISASLLGNALIDLIEYIIAGTDTQ